MKLSELAQQYNLATESLQEACELLKIKLPKGLDSVLKEADAAKVLSFGGLETVDGQEFTPIIAKEFEDKHKRTVAAKKAAETRKKKLSEEDQRKKQDDDIRLVAERRKHEEELARRDAERMSREALDAAAAARRIELEALTKAELDSARAAAEEDLRRRETEAKRISAEFAVLRGATANGGASEGGSTTISETPVDRIAAPTPVAEQPAPVATPVQPAPPTAPVQPSASELALAKATKGLGSKLASMAKATHEKADHSIKAIPKPALDPHGATISKGSDESLSPEDRRRLIQENIRKNLAMAQRVRDNKLAEKGRRKPGFAPIDRAKNPGGPGAGRGPARPGQRPGPPGLQRGPKRDSKDHRTERPEEYDAQGNKITNRRRPLSTEDLDLSGKTEFEIAQPCTVRVQRTE